MSSNCVALFCFIFCDSVFFIFHYWLGMDGYLVTVQSFKQYLS